MAPLLKGHCVFRKPEISQMHPVGASFHLASAQRRLGPFTLAGHTVIRPRENEEPIPAYVITTPRGETITHSAKHLTGDMQIISL